MDSAEAKPGLDDGFLVAYARSALARHALSDWSVDPGEFWCSVNPAGGRRRLQGWKLHVAATPLSAPLVLARAAEVLTRHRCAFKFAETIGRVRELVSPNIDRGSGGKFITAYPEGDDDELRALAEELHQATAGLPGPGILSDRRYRPGSLVHYRFGAFSGVPMLGNDGTYEAMLIAPDGNLVQDQRKAWFTPPWFAPRDPFTAAPAGAGDPARARPKATAAPDNGDGPTRAAPKPVQLAGRYVVGQAIRHKFAGGVYRATDERTGAAVIIKQARRHTAADESGQDARDVRRHEADMLEQFQSSGLTPRPVDLFEQQGDLFLVQEQLPGVTLREWVAGNVLPGDGGTWGPSPADATRIANRLVDLVETVHEAGLVVRDFNPNNVMVTDDGDLRLIDLELLARPGDLVARSYTLGYGAPEQVAAPGLGPAPRQEADLYGLGATLFYLVSGVDPVLPRDEPTGRPIRDRIENWLDAFSIANPSARRLAAVIVGLLHEDPAQRPTLDAVRPLLARKDDAQAQPIATTGNTTAGSRSFRETDLKRTIGDAIEYLVSTMDPTSSSRLWPPSDFGGTTDPLNVQHGAAGVLGVLTLACAAEPDAALRTAVATTAGWISRHVTREPRALPGLHFGRSGTAWALLDAGLLLGDDDLVHLAMDLARRVPIRWPNPDVCHGTAGAGLTQLRFWERTGHDDFLDRARCSADALVAAAKHRGGLVRWPVPRDFASDFGGMVHYGFAHGTAGVGAFLLAAGRATGESAYLDLATSAADALVSVAEVDRGAAYWTSGDDDNQRKTHWCSGSSGVGTFLVRVWQQTGHDRFRDLAAKAALAVRRSRWHAGPSQCHGLAGDAEYLLDLAEAFGEERYRDWADELATCIYLRHALRDGRMVAPNETGTAVVAEFNTGLGGVLAFLLRLRDGSPRLWLPESFTNW